MSDLEATRLLLTPICHRAPTSSPGDVVRVTDGTTTIYLEPADYDTADETQLRALIRARAMARPDTTSWITADDSAPSAAGPRIGMLGS